MLSPSSPVTRLKGMLSQRPQPNLYMPYYTHTSYSRSHTSYSHKANTISHTCSDNSPDADYSYL